MIGLHSQADRPYCKPSNTTFLGLNFLRVLLHMQNKINAKKNYYPSSVGCYFTIWGMVLYHCAKLSNDFVSFCDAVHA